jgi:hypothetical protein
MVMALILAVTIVAVVVLTRPRPAPAPAAPNFYDQQQEQAVACMQGGGTWIKSGISGYCSHI